jgi:hypothetical protein
MNRFGNDQDQEIVELLGRLKDTGPEYPPRMFAARRAAVLAALAALPIGGAIAISLFSKLAAVVKSMSVVDKIVLGLEVAAITGVTAYGATAAYIYRDELEALLFPEPTVVNTSTSIPTELSPVPVIPAFGETPSGTPTLTPAPTGTIYLTDTNVPTGDQVPQATPADPEPTNPGLHLGNTKTPRPRGP